MYRYLVGFLLQIVELTNYPRVQVSAHDGRAVKLHCAPLALVRVAACRHVRQSVKVLRESEREVKCGLK